MPLLENPIVGKEFKGNLRSRKALALTLVYVLVLSALVLLMWPAEGINPLIGHRAREIFTVVVVVQLAMLLLFAPPFAATSITSEKDANTYESLYCTHLSAGSIVFGKLAGATGFLLLLVVFSLPIGAVCMILGGVGLGEFFLAYLVLAASGILFGLVGIACSALMRKSFNSLVGSYAILIAMCGLVQLPPLLLPGWETGQFYMHLARCISPFSAVFAVTQGAFRARGPRGDVVALGMFFGFFALASVVLLGLAIVGARRSAARPPRARRAAISRETPLLRRIFRRVFFVIDPQRRARMIPLFVNPVLILEFRSRVASVTNMLRAIFACIIFSIGLVILVAGTWGAASVDVVRFIAVSFQFSLIVLLAPTLTVGAISSEVENRTLELLRMAPVGWFRVLTGKLGAALAYSVMLLFAILPVFVVVMFIREKFEPEQIKAVLGVSAGTILVAVTSGLFFSSLCRRTSSAAALTYGLMGFIVVATSLPAVVGERLSEKVSRAILSLNPIVSVVSTMSQEMFERYCDVWKWNVLAMCVISGAALVGAAWRLRRLMEPMK